MVLKIRLRQQGKRNQHVYRLVLSESRSPRDGKYLETLGWYNPRSSKPELILNVYGDRLQHWLNQGAVLTEKAASLVNQAQPELLAAFRKKQLAVQAKECQKKRAYRKKKALVAAEK